MLASLRGLILRQFRLHAVAASTVSDAELLRRFVAGRDEAAFELLLWRHGSLVLDACQSLLGDAHAAEDAFQATFLTLVRKASAIRRREALAGWLHQVACRIALRLRGQTALRRAREHPDFVAVSSAPDRPAADPGTRDGRRLLHEEVQRLPGKYRQPIVLCYFQGLTHEAAAEQLGWPKGTVAGRLARARELLHRRLTGRGVTLGVGGVVSLLVVDHAAATVSAALAQSTLKTAALAVSGQTAAIAGPIVVLSKGVMRTMLWQKVKHLAAMLLIVATAGGGACWLIAGQSDLKPAVPPTQDGKDKAAAAKDQDGDPGGPSAKPDDPVTGHLRTARNLKQIGVAMHSYNDTYKHFPGPAIFSGTGTPLLSWRVALLPYLDQHNLYKQFRLDEPWDSDHNKKLLAKMPDVYRSPGAKDTSATHYQVFVGKGTIFEGPKGIGIFQIPDGLSNTIMVVEAAGTVPWTKPEDLAYAPTGKIPELGGVHPGVFYALFADGSVSALKRRCAAEDLRIAITRDDQLEMPRKRLIDPAPALDDPIKLQAALDQQLLALRKTEDEIQKQRATLRELLRAAARERGVGAVDQGKWVYEVIQDELELARHELTKLQARIDELRKNRP